MSQQQVRDSQLIAEARAPATTKTHGRVIADLLEFHRQQRLDPYKLSETSICPFLTLLNCLFCFIINYTYYVFRSYECRSYVILGLMSVGLMKQHLFYYLVFNVNIGLFIHIKCNILHFLVSKTSSLTAFKLLFFLQRLKTKTLF